MAPVPVHELTAAMGDRARMAMLLALASDDRLSASCLADVADVSPSTASAHLKKLENVGLLRARTDGRRRMFTLANPDLLPVLDGLQAVAELRPVADQPPARQTDPPRISSDTDLAPDDAALPADQDAELSPQALGVLSRICSVLRDKDLVDHSGAESPLTQRGRAYLLARGFTSAAIATLAEIEAATRDGTPPVPSETPTQDIIAFFETSGWIDPKTGQIIPACESCLERMFGALPAR